MPLGPFDCAAVTLATCQAVSRQLAEDDLARPTPCTGYTVGEVCLPGLRLSGRSR